MSTNAPLSKNGCANPAYVNEQISNGDTWTEEDSQSPSLVDQTSIADTVVLASNVGRALSKLARAYQFSQDCDRPKWDFAVDLLELEQLGVSHDELRWLIGKGLIDHARETESPGETRRTFDSPGGFAFAKHSCFVITESGIELSQHVKHVSTEQSASTVALDVGESHAMWEPVGDDRPKPFWDVQRHELRFGRLIVKRFKWRALNQEAILAAFQEEGWPVRIDDPLPPTPETDPKRRLSDAIKCLNRKQQNHLLRFSGDGTGEGVFWDLVTSNLPDASGKTPVGD